MAATALPRDGVALQTVVRVPLFAIFSQPPLPRFIQFPHSSRHLLLPFGTIPAPCCPSNPSPPFFLLLPSTSTFPMDRPHRLFHLIHSVGQRPRRPARQRHAVLPPSTMGASSVCTLNSPPRLPCLCTCSTTLGSCLGCSLCLYQRPAVSKKKRKKE